MRAPLEIAAGRVALPLLLLASASALPQTPPEPGPAGGAPGFHDEVSVGMVLVPVVVRRNGRFVDDLEAEDFTLFVDERPVRIETVDRSETAPISVMVLQDLSGSMALGRRLALSRHAVSSLAALHRPGDRFALMAFGGGRVRTLQEFTLEAESLLTAFDAARPHGTTALHDAVSTLPGLAAAIASTRRGAILITDGADNASRIAAAEAREQVRRAELPVYVIGLDTGSPRALDRAGRKLHRHADILNLLAFVSGGRYLPAGSEEGAATACREALAELRHQYVLGFTAGASGPSRERALRVAVAKRKLELTFRRAYFGRAPQVAPPPGGVR